MSTTFHLFLKNRQKKNGEYPIYLRITNNRKHKYITTGISVLKKHWDSEKEKILSTHQNSKTLNNILQVKLMQARQAQLEVINESINHSTDGIIMAEQQLLGYSHAKKGYSLAMLIESMGLTRKEWSELKNSYSLDYLSNEDVEEIEKYMINQTK